VARERFDWRVFTPAESQMGADREVIFSHKFWVRRFAGDRHIVGRNVRIVGCSVSLVGVMPLLSHYTWLLLGVTGLVLLMACANVANCNWHAPPAVCATCPSGRRSVSIRSA